MAPLKCKKKTREQKTDRPELAAPGAEVSSTAATVLQSELASLRAELEQESFEREMLAADVELMRAVIEQLATERSAEVVAPARNRHGSERFWSVLVWISSSTARRSECSSTRSRAASVRP